MTSPVRRTSTALSAQPARLPRQLALGALSLATLLAALALTATPAHADAKGDRQAEIWFGMLDGDKDGFLSWDEVKNVKPLAKEFKSADTNGDGKVSRDEIRALSKRRVAERRARQANEAQAAAQAQAPAAPAAPPAAKVEESVPAAAAPASAP